MMAVERFERMYGEHVHHTALSLMFFLYFCNPEKNRRGFSVTARHFDDNERIQVVLVLVFYICIIVGLEKKCNVHFIFSNVLVVMTTNHIIYDDNTMLRTLYTSGQVAMKCSFPWVPLRTSGPRTHDLVGCTIPAAFLDLLCAAVQNIMDQRIISYPGAV